MISLKYVIITIILIILLINNITISLTIITLQEANIPYEAIPIANVKIYSTDLGNYGKIYSVYPHGDYLYAITDMGYLLRSKDGVNWEVLGNVLPNDLKVYAPHKPLDEGGIFVTSNGTIIVNFCNSTAGVYVLLRGIENKFPFEVVMENGGCWWSNAHIIETKHGTLITVFYGGPYAFNGLVFRSIDMGKTWTLVANITAMTTPNGRCLAARHIHWLWYDPTTDTIWVIGGERDSSQPNCLDRVTIISKDDGLTWEFFGRPYNDGPSISIGNIAIYGGHGFSKLIVIQHNFTYDSIYIIGYLHIPEKGIQQMWYDFDEEVLYHGDQDIEYKDGYFEAYAWSLKLVGEIPIIYPVEIFKVNLYKNWWKSVCLVGFKDKIINIFGYYDDWAKYIAIYRKLTSDEVIYYAYQQFIKRELFSHGKYIIPIKSYVDTVRLHIKKLELYNKSVSQYILYRENFENGLTTGWGKYPSDSYAQVSVVNIGYYGNYSLNYTAISSSYIYKEIKFHVPIPTGSTIVIAGWAKQLGDLCDVNIAYDLEGVAQIRYADATCIIGKFTDETITRIDHIFGASDDHRSLIWRPVYLDDRYVKLSKDLKSVTVKLGFKYKSCILLLDEISIYIINETLASKIPMYLYPCGEENNIIYINGTPYDISSGVIELEFHKYVDSLVLDIPCNVGILNITIEKIGAKTNVPLKLINNTYVYTHGSNKTYIEVKSSDKPIIVPLTNETEIKSISFINKKLSLVLSTRSGSVITVAVYPAKYGKPQYVKINGKVITKSLASKTEFDLANYDCWFFDDVANLIYVKAVAHSNIPIEISWEAVDVGIRYRELNFTIIYSPNASSFTTTLTATNVSTAKIEYPHSWTYKIYVTPYTNNTSYLTPDINATLLGTWVSGIVGDLAYQDYIYFAFDTFNDTNTMRLHLTLNVTTLSWLVTDSTIKINEIEILIAGNCSKYVNTKASLEILDWSTNSWLSIDDVAWNQTNVVIKTYKLSSIYSGDLKNLISSSGVIAFRINITDVQTYPSTIIRCTFDQLNVKVIYTNETEAIVESIITIPFIPNSTIYVHNITLSIRANGTGTLREVKINVLDSLGNVIKSIANATFSTTWTDYVVPIEQNVANNITIKITTHLISTLTSNEEVDIANIRLCISSSANLSITWYCLYPTINVMEADVKTYRFNCTLAIPLIRGLLYSNYTKFRLKIPTYFKLEKVVHGLSEVTSKEVGIINFEKVIEFENALGNAYTYIYHYEPITYIDDYGVIHVKYDLPVSSISLFNVSTPTPFIAIMFKNGSWFNINDVKYLLTHYHKEVEFYAKILYGRIITPNLWIHLNPRYEGVIKDIVINSTHLLITLDGETGKEFELIVKVPYKPYRVMLDNEPIQIIEEPILYSRCLDKCVFYNRSDSVLRIRAKFHSPIIVTIEVEVPSIPIAIYVDYPSEVYVDEQFNIKITIVMSKPVIKDTTLKGLLKCNGISKTFDIIIPSGLDWGETTISLILTQAKTYLCTVIVEDLIKQFTITAIEVVKPKPFKIPLLTILLLLFLLTILIIIIIVYLKREREVIIYIPKS